MPRRAQARPLKDVAGFIQPMKPTMVSRLPDGRSKWLLEPKLDGYRMVAVKSAELPPEPYPKLCKFWELQSPCQKPETSTPVAQSTAITGKLVHLRWSTKRT
jgi:hypothetical protein